MINLKIQKVYLNKMDKTVCLWTCDNCRTALKNPLKCGKCMCAPYCNRECQKADWKEHKKVCCIDIVLPSDEEMNKLVSELIKIIKSNKKLVEKIIIEYSLCRGKQLVVLSVIHNRKIHEFQQLNVSTMSILSYQKLARSKELYDTNDYNLYIIMMSERNQLMVNGIIPLSNLI